MDDVLAYSALPVRNYMTHAQERGQSLAEHFVDKTDDVAEILETRDAEEYKKNTDNSADLHEANVAAFAFGHVDPGLAAKVGCVCVRSRGEGNFDSVPAFWIIRGWLCGRESGEMIGVAARSCLMGDHVGFLKALFLQRGLQPLFLRRLRPQRHSFRQESLPVERLEQLGPVEFADQFTHQVCLFEGREVLNKLFGDLLLLLLAHAGHVLICHDFSGDIVFFFFFPRRGYTKTRLFSQERPYTKQHRIEMSSSVHDKMLFLQNFSYEMSN